MNEVSMNHLTTTEMFQIVDGTIANGEKTRLLVHLETCERCRREVEFHRTLGHAVKEAPRAKLSKDFTRRIVGRVAPEKKKPWTASVLDNLGNIMAMGLVLGIVWYAINIAPAPKSSSEPSAITKAFAAYVEYYGRVRDAASGQMKKVLGEPKKEQASRSNDIVATTLISLLILVAVDRVVGRRVTKIRA